MNVALWSPTYYTDFRSSFLTPVRPSRYFLTFFFLCICILFFSYSLRGFGFVVVVQKTREVMLVLVCRSRNRSSSSKEEKGFQCSDYIEEIAFRERETELRMKAPLSPSPHLLFCTTRTKMWRYNPLRWRKEALFYIVQTHRHWTLSVSLNTAEPRRKSLFPCTYFSLFLADFPRRKLRLFIRNLVIMLWIPERVFLFFIII